MTRIRNGYKCACCGHHLGDWPPDNGCSSCGCGTAEVAWERATDDSPPDKSLSQLLPSEPMDDMIADSDLRLHCGEMTAAELRACRAGYRLALARARAARSS